MPWNNGRRKVYIPVAIRRAVDQRSGGECEAKKPGCLIDSQLEYHHIIGVEVFEGPIEALNSEDNIARLCHHCHNLETQAQARVGATNWKLQPERHPGLKW